MPGDLSLMSCSATAIGMLAQTTDFITWQERLTSPFLHHSLQLLASTVIGGVLGLLGCFVVLRRMSLIGDAISHAVLPGVVIAFLLVSTGIAGLFIGALTAGIITAVMINLVTRYSRVKEDAAIGIVFTAMFALGVVLVSWLPSGTHFDMKCFLFGDPLAVQREDMLMIALIAPTVVALVALLYHPLKLMCFDSTLAVTMGFRIGMLHYLLMILLSATIVAALRSVGVIMGVAMLITPAAVAYQLTNRLAAMLMTAAFVGCISAFSGMFLAFQIDSPPGPTMVLVASATFLLAMIFAPERGVLIAWLRRHRIRLHIIEEDVLKALVRAEEATSGGPSLPGATAMAVVPSVHGARSERAARANSVELSHADLTAALPTMNAREIRGALARLAGAGLITLNGTRNAGSALTDAGRSHATHLVRSHRLWETYLAAEGDAADIHESAERLEHA
ncbi:MAG: metal ABC transporter permease, partial [Phycisphaerales bacterium]|nr:metal ABC transporter permease [Phycisphaerales bacterium]